MTTIIKTFINPPLVERIYSFVITKCFEFTISDSPSLATAIEFFIDEFV